MQVIPQGYYELAFKHSLQGSLHTSVATLGVRYTGADLKLDFHNIAASYGQHMTQSINDVWAFEGMTASNQEGAVFEDLLHIQGGVSHLPCTGNIAFIMRKLTGFPGRKNRGRLYLPGVSEQDVDHNGMVQQSKLTELQNNLNNWTIAFQGAHTSVQLFHNMPEGGNPVNYAPTPLTDLRWESQVGTQRRRMPRAS